MSVRGTSDIGVKMPGKLRWYVLRMGSWGSNTYSLSVPLYASMTAFTELRM